jgi:hypothetical protein
MGPPRVDYFFHYVVIGDKGVGLIQIETIFNKDQEKLA